MKQTEVSIVFHYLIYLKNTGFPNKEAVVYTALRRRMSWAATQSDIQKLRVLENYITSSLLK